jgi:hypothetical protein
VFYLKQGKQMLPVPLERGDRIRVRPALKQFCVWRKVPRRPGAHLRLGAARLWIQEPKTGIISKWLGLPDVEGPETMILAIMRRYGVENFGAPKGMRWLEEEPEHLFDGRYDIILF